MCSSTLLRSLAALLASSLLGFAAPRATRAQDCDCDHVIAPGTGGVDGTALGIAPGDVVCLMAGSYDYIRFRELRGTAAAPIVIKNCGGVVDVANSDRGYGVDFQGSSAFFHITGTGEDSLEYGIRISASRSGPDYSAMGLWFLDKSTNYEADHIEVHDTGFAGVMAKTDPLCDGSADQGTFTQRDVHIHHMWVHDTGGEAFYVGSTQSDGQNISCGGVTMRRQPHFLEGVELDHNLVEDTEWDGMQVGMARANCRVHHNVIRRVGTADELYQQQGLQIGTFSACDVRANDLREGPAMGIIVLGAGDSTFADNVIVDFAEDGIYINLDDQPAARYTVNYNTIVGFGRNALSMFGGDVTAAVANNYVVGPDSALAINGAITMRTVSNNVFAADRAAAGFVGASDYHLSATSPARGAGVDLAAMGFATDHDDQLRATPPSVGAYEYTADVPDGGPGRDAGTSTMDGGGGPGSDGGGVRVDGGTRDGGGVTGDGGGGAVPESEDGGCGCRVAAAQSTRDRGALAAIALCGLALGLRKRRRAVGLAALALAATLVGCGDDGGGDRMPTDGGGPGDSAVADLGRSDAGTTDASTTDAGANDAGAVGTDGCGRALDIATEEFVSRTLDVGGSARTFFVRLPAAYDADRRYPVIYQFHGCSSDAARENNNVGLDGEVGADAILVRGRAADNCWDTATGGPDVPYVDALFGAVEATWCADSTRRFATGYSSGAFMTHRLACIRGSMLRGVASIAGGQGGSGCTGNVAALLIHDTNDTTVNISASEGARDSHLDRNGCDATAATTPTDHPPCVAYAGCDADKPVVWCQTSGMNHSRQDALAAPAFWDFLSALF